MLRPLTVCTLLFLGGIAGAQERMPPPKGPPLDEIAMAVGLKDTQRASFQEILEQHHAAMIALHEAMRSRHDALEQQTRASLAKVLTPEQLARFDQWHGSHRPPPPLPPPLPPAGLVGQSERPRAQDGYAAHGQMGARGPGMGPPMGPGPGMYGPYAEGPGNAVRLPPPPQPPEQPYARSQRARPGMRFDQGQRPPPPPGMDDEQGPRPPPPPGMGFGQGHRPPPPPGGPFGEGNRPPPPPPDGDGYGQPLPPPGDQQ